MAEINYPVGRFKDPILSPQVWGKTVQVPTIPEMFGVNIIVREGFTKKGIVPDLSTEKVGMPIRWG